MEKAKKVVKISFKCAKLNISVIEIIASQIVIKDFWNSLFG